MSASKLANEPGHLLGSPADLTTSVGWKAFCEAEERRAAALPSDDSANVPRGAGAGGETPEPGLRLPVLRTDQLEKVRSQAELLRQLNTKPSPGARPGLVIDGEASTGKTTAALAAGRWWQAKSQAQSDDRPARNEFVPVVYVTLPASATSRSISASIVSFYGIEPGSRANKDRLTRVAKELATGCGTSLIIVDDIHYLDASRHDGTLSNNHLNYLANLLPVTFIYAGIGVESHPLLSESGKLTFSQTASRFSLVRMCPYQDPDSEEWLALVLGFEKALGIASTPNGRPSRSLMEYLFDRSGGKIGSLAFLLRAAAYVAGAEGARRVTKKHFEAVTIDYAAETSFARRQRRRTSAA